jgi:hypothetical protein
LILAILVFSFVLIGVLLAAGGGYLLVNESGSISQAMGVFFLVLGALFVGFDFVLLKQCCESCRAQSGVRIQTNPDLEAAEVIPSEINYRHALVFRGNSREFKQAMENAYAKQNSEILDKISVRLIKEGSAKSLWQNGFFRIPKFQEQGQINEHTGLLTVKSQ